jgi:hypothetical protein
VTTFVCTSATTAVDFNVSVTVTVVLPTVTSIGNWRAWPRIRRGAVTAARCLLDLLGPAQRVLAADGEVAGGADSFLVIFRFGATLELGRSARTTLRPR